ncbi:transposase [Patescibacteria group bacterium]|nr:transposase [Patescibacteria group bacterium]
MRKEPFTVGSYVHVYNRGNRKQVIVHDTKDRWRFLQILYYFNNRFSPENIFRELRKLFRLNLNKQFTWPESWPERKPIVKIINFFLADNHFHLLLKEIQDGGIAMFMKKLGDGMTGYFNKKYQETGRLFQGSYKARLVDKDIYFKYLSVYIQVKNAFEFYPGGLEKAIREFDKAFEFAINNPFCSLADFAGDRHSPIIDKDLLGKLFPNKKDYKKFAKECILGRKLEERLGGAIKDFE